MSIIFISHSSKDNTIAEEIKEWLQDNGYTSLFLDFDPQEGIPAGEEWEQELYRKLRACRALVVICSHHSLRSCWCFAEIAFARSEGKPIFPIRIDEVTLPPQLGDVQVIDLLGEPENLHRRLSKGLSHAGLDPRAIHAWDPERSPYPGLNYFAEEDAAIFFGRENLIWEGLDRLRAMRVHGGPFMLLILGVSGSGKSSLLRAGLLPRLRKNKEDWCILSPFRPGSDPLTGLATSISAAFIGGAAAGHSAPQVRAALAANHDPLSVFRNLLGDLRRCHKCEAATVLIPIDQLEELFIGDASANPDTGTFLSILRGILQGKESQTLLVATLRTDLLGLLQDRPEWADVCFEQLFFSQMGPEGYAQAIEGPAALAGLRLESGLTQRIVADIGTDDALPLLAFTLQQLWERYGREVGVLTIEDYLDRLGGLPGAVQREADAVLRAAALDSVGMSLLHQAFLEMARLDDQGRISRRPAHWSSIHADIRPVLTRFVKARLLLEGREEGTVEVAHEALLRHWSVLENWLQEDQDFMQWRRRLGGALEEYERSGEVLGQAPLVEALHWKDRIPPAGPERDLIERSEEAQRQAEERERLVLLRQAEDQARLSIKDEEISILGRAVEEGTVQKERLIRQGRRVFLAFIGLAWFTGVGALVATRKLVVATTATQLEQASAVLRRQHADDQLTALTSAVANGFRLRELVGRNSNLSSYPTVAPLSTLEALLGTTWERWRQSAHRYGTVSIISLGPSGGTVSIGKDDQLRFWGPRGEKKRERSLPGGTAISASHDGRTIFVGTADGNLIRLDREGRERTRWSAHPIGGVNALAIGPEPNTIVSAGGDGMVIIWSFKGRRLASWRAALQEEGVQDLAVDHAGRRIATVGESLPQVRVWAADGSPLLSLLAPAGGPLVKVAIGEGGKHLLAAGSGKEIWLWHALGSRPVSGPLQLKGLSLPIRSLSLLQEDHTLAAGDAGGTIHIWKASGEPMATLRGHDGAVNHLATTAKGFISAGDDGTLRNWQPPATSLVRIGGSSVPIHAIHVHPRGRETALAMADGSVRIVTLAGAQVRSWSTRRGSLSSLDIHPDGSKLVVAGSTGRVRLWSWMGEQGALKEANAASIVSVRMGPRRGDQIVAGASDGILWWWSTAGAKLAKWDAHPGHAVSMVAIHPSERTLATVGTDGWVRTWWANGHLRAATRVSRRAVRAVVFDPSGRKLVAAGDDSKVSLIGPSGGVIRTFPTYQSSISGMAFSPDGGTLATAGSDGSLKLWDTSGRLRGNDLITPGQPLYGLAFDNTGRWLFSGGGAGTLGIRRVEDLMGLLRQGCAVLANPPIRDGLAPSLRQSCAKYWHEQPQMALVSE